MKIARANLEPITLARMAVTIKMTRNLLTGGGTGVSLCRRRIRVSEPRACSDLVVQLRLRTIHPVQLAGKLKMNSYEPKTMQSLPQAKLYAYGSWAS
jgi:hypothetical protein